MAPYLIILETFEKELAGIDLGSDSIFKELYKAIWICKRAIEKLREQFQQTGFADIEAECYFFKQIKPKLVSKLIFYVQIAVIEKSRPQGDKEQLVKYMREQVDKLAYIFSTHSEFYEYQLQDRTDRDFEYFTRVYSRINFETHALFYCSDGEFSTSHDFLLAQFMAHKDLIGFYSEKYLGGIAISGTLKPSSNLHWTGLKVDLVELIYALHASGMVANGRAPIKELAKGMERLFMVNLGDYYRIFLEIRGRKGSQTKLLDFLKISLVNRIIEIDG